MNSRSWIKLLKILMHKHQGQYKKINEIVGYNESTDQYILQSAGDITLVDSSELFNKVNNNEVVVVNGIEGVIPSMSVSYGEDYEIFVREGTQMEVEKFTLSDFNEKLIEILDTADSMREYTNVRDNNKQVVLDDLIREGEERMQMYLMTTLKTTNHFH